MRDVCVIGLGLIGGSVLRGAIATGRTAWGATSSDEDANAASNAGYRVLSTVDESLGEAAERDALVVLAVPFTALENLLQAVDQHAPDCLLTDVTSVKAPVQDLVRRYAPQARYVGGHPMAGTAQSGWSAGHADLFQQAAWVATIERKTDLLAWQEVSRLALDLGSHVVPVSAEDHDLAVARISHLPHVLAAVLAAVGARGGPLALSLAAGSYQGGTRVAGTRPELVQAMVENNREALLSTLDEALGDLGAARGSLASTGSLAATVRAGHAGTQALTEFRAAASIPYRIDLNSPGAHRQLTDLGICGGRVTAIEGMVAMCEKPLVDNSAG